MSYPPIKDDLSRYNIMLDPKDFPLLDSFEIEIMESWMDMDIGQSEKKVITGLSQLGVVYPFSGDSSTRKYYSINTEDIFRACYRSQKSKRIISKDYVDTRKKPKGDDGRITRNITCKIKYKEKKIEVQDL